jgi:hypothetical protein
LLHCIFGRQDRQDEIGSLHDVAKRWHVLETSFFGKGAGALASPVKAGNHAHSMLAENGSASMPHITRHQDGNAIKGFCFGHWIGLYAGKGVFALLVSHKA